MELLDKMMSNITGITLGCGFMFSGLLVFKNPSIAWLQNIFIFFGLYIIVISMVGSVRQYIASKDPNFDRITVISQYANQTMNANALGKAKAFIVMAAFIAAAAAASLIIDRLWVCAAVMVISYAVSCIRGIKEKNTAIAQDENAENASNTGKAKAFDLMAVLYGALLFVLPIMGASWKILLIVALSYIISEIISIRVTYLEFARLWAERGVNIR